MKNSCLPLALRSLTDPSDAKNAAKELERFVVKCLAPNADVRRARSTARRERILMLRRCTTSLALCAHLCPAKTKMQAKVGRTRPRSCILTVAVLRRRLQSLRLLLRAREKL